MNQIKIILASASPRRKELLNQIGIVPVIMPGDIDEQITSHVPSIAVESLSKQKASYIGGILKESDRIDSVVLGADTVVAAAGKILGKPDTEEEAKAMLCLLQGGCHQVYTGVTLLSGGKSLTFSEKTDVYVYPMSDGEIEDYIAYNESMDKAGAYGIQGHFAAYIEKIDGSYTNVMGLPVGRVYQELKQLMEEQND